MLLDLTDGNSTLATVLGLVPDDAKPLPEPMLIQLFLTYMASLGYNELISFLGRSCGLRSKAVDYHMVISSDSSLEIVTTGGL